MAKKTHTYKVNRRKKVQRSQAELSAKEDLFRRELGVSRKLFTQMRRYFMEDELKAIGLIWEKVGGMTTDARSRVLQFIANKHSEKAQLEAEAKEKLKESTKATN